jgi:hypothetical protein
LDGAEAKLDEIELKPVVGDGSGEVVPIASAATNRSSGRTTWLRGPASLAAVRNSASAPDELARRIASSVVLGTEANG